MVDHSDSLITIAKEQMGQLSMTVKVDKDKLSLFVDTELCPNGDKFAIDRDSLLLMLGKQVKPDFVNLGVLDSIAASANSGKGVKDRKIAQGSLPTDGENGRIEYLVKPVELPENKGDVRFAKSLPQVVPDMFLAITHPPTEGIPGMNVFGEAAKGKSGTPVKIAADRSLKRKPSTKDGGIEYLISKAHGFLVKDKDHLRIESTLHIKTGVDVTMVEVSCNGNIQVEGEIAKGCSVHAQDDIYIKGRTYGSTLSSKNGSIKVDNLVLGGPGITVSAANDVSAYMSLNLKINADGHILIGKEARDSTLNAGGGILMKHGHLFGGESQALSGIEASVIGSDGGTLTVVGAKTKAALEGECVELSRELDELQKLETAITQKIGMLIMPDLEKLPVFEAPQCKKLNEVLIKLDQVKRSRRTLQHRFERIKSALDKEPWFQVNYGQVIHKGTVIRIGEAQKVIDSDIRGPGTIEYSLKTGEFKVVKYREIPAAKELKKAGMAAVL